MVDEIVAAWLQTAESLKGIVIGGLLTLGVTTLATILANRHARRLQRQQFEFEHRQRKAERDHAMRREVYLRASEAVSTAMSAISSVGNLSTSDEQLNSASHELSVALGRVQTVAKPHTMRAAANFGREYSVALATLQLARTDITARLVRIKFAEDSRDKAMAESDRLLEMMKMYNLELVKDASRWAALQRAFDRNQAMQGEFIRNVSKLHREQARSQVKIMRLTVDTLPTLQPLLREALLAIREELDLEDASSAMAQELHRTEAEMREFFENVMRRLEEDVARDEAEDAAEEQAEKTRESQASDPPR